MCIYIYIYIYIHTYTYTHLFIHTYYITNTYKQESHAEHGYLEKAVVLRMRLLDEGKQVAAEVAVNKHIYYAMLCYAILCHVM